MYFIVLFNFSLPKRTSLLHLLIMKSKVTVTGKPKASKTDDKPKPSKAQTKTSNSLQFQIDNDKRSKSVPKSPKKPLRDQTSNFSKSMISFYTKHEYYLSKCDSTYQTKQIIDLCCKFYGRVLNHNDKDQLKQLVTTVDTAVTQLHLHDNLPPPMEKSDLFQKISSISHRLDEYISKKNYHEDQNLLQTAYLAQLACQSILICESGANKTEDHFQTILMSVDETNNKIFKQVNEIPILREKVETGITALETKMDTRITALETKMDTRTTALETKMETLETKMETLETKMETLETKMDTRITALETKMDTRITALETKMDTRITALETNVNDLGKQMTELKTSISNQLTEILKEIQKQNQQQLVFNNRITDHVLHIEKFLKESQTVQCTLQLPQYKEFIASQTSTNQ